MCIMTVNSELLTGLLVRWNLFSTKRQYFSHIFKKTVFDAFLNWFVKATVYAQLAFSWRKLNVQKCKKKSNLGHYLGMFL